MSYIVMAFSIASIAGVPLGAYLGGLYGWQSPFAVLAGVCLVGWVLIFCFFPSHLLKKEKKTTPNVPDLPPSGINFQAFVKAITVPIRFWALLFSFLMMLGHFAVGPFISQYLSGNLDYTDTQIAWVYFWVGIATSIVAPLVGYFSDKIGKNGVFLLGNSLVILVVLLMAFFLKGSDVLITLLIAFLYVFLTARAIPSIAVVTSVVPTAERASFMNIRSVANQLASGLAPLIGGFLIVQNPDKSLLGFEYICLFAAFTALLAFFPFQKMIAPKN